MNSYTLSNLRRDKDSNLYDLSQKTVTNSVPIRTLPYTVKVEEEMRLDKICYNIYNTDGLVEEVMALNGILNPWSVKAGDVINLFYIEDISLLQWTEPEKNQKQTSLSNPNKNTQQDTNRLSPTDNPGIVPVVLDKKAKKIKIMDKLG